MCGIGGWFTNNKTRFGREHLEGMTQTLHHRGPDDSGVFFQEESGIGLSHNRLSIIDLSHNGHQPMVNEKTGDVLVFNGEIYNFKEIRTTLQGLGHGFRSQTDSEVLLLAFAEWGIKCVNRLKGMFAFAIWSPSTQELHLARDPMGVKPLYYWRLPKNEGFVFASEIRAFLALPGFERNINKTSLNQFLEFGYSFAEETIFAEVLKLPPGHWMKVEKGKAGKPIRYFDPVTKTNQTACDKGALEEELFETLDEVIGQHLVADVPVGLLLSGGLDSSLIASIASRHADIKTFSMGFGDSQIDERPFARMASDFIGSEHHELEIMPGEITKDLEKNISYFDDIFADWGMISTRLLYQKCRDQGIKVVIVGEGSDELFGGYGIFRMSLPRASKGPEDWQLFQIYRQYAGRRYGDQFFAFRNQMRSYLRATNRNWFDAIRMFESRNQLSNNYVMKVDKASMAVSVEARVPFLDSRVAEFAYRIPGNLLLEKNSEKRLLRSMAEKFALVPKEILNRRKFGASIAVSWMDESPDFRKFSREVILGSQSLVDELGLRKAMEDYFDEGKTGYRFPRAISHFRNLAWRLLILNLWSRSFLNPAYGG